MLDADTIPAPAAPLSWRDLDSLVEWCAENPTPFHWLEVGAGIRRDFGKHGEDAFRLIALYIEPPDPDSPLPPAWEAALYHTWNGPVVLAPQDAMRMAWQCGWQPSPDMLAVFAADAAREAAADTERTIIAEAEHRAATDAEHAAWVASGEPDTFAADAARYFDIIRRGKAEMAALVATMKEQAPMIPTPLSLVPPAPPADAIQTSAEFVSGFTPPDYLIDGTLQRQFFYAITAQTGVGKTAVAMLLTALVGTGRPLGKSEVDKGDVLYLAGENPTDVRMRWLGITRHLGIDPAKLNNVHFLPGSMDLARHAAGITAEIVRKGIEPALVVVDTAAAYNAAEDENSNTQMGLYARQLRSLTVLPGRPCVIVLCHPTKGASDANEMLPRGGGAFLAELDGNITLVRKDTLLIAEPGKMRGSGGWSMRFDLEVMRDHPLLRDAKGRHISTVIAKPADDAAEERIQRTRGLAEDAVLRAIDKAPGLSLTALAKALGWTYGARQETDRNKAQRTCQRLAGAEGGKLVKETRGGWHLTSAGEQAVNELDRIAATAPPAPHWNAPPLPPKAGV